MEIFYTLFSFFFLAPMLLGLLARLKERVGTLKAFRDDYLIPVLRAPGGILSIIILGSFCLILLCLGYKLLTGEINPSVILALLTIPFVATVTLVYQAFRKSKIYEAAPLPFNAAFTYLALWVTWLAGTAAADYIMTATRLNAADLPVALTGLTLLYLPAAWLLASSGLFIGLYMLMMVGLTLIPFIFEHVEKAQGTTKAHSLSFVFISAIIGCIFTITAPFKAVSVLEDSQLFKSFLLGTLITSGYPLKENPCGKSGIEDHEEDRYNVLSSGEFGVARYISPTKYSFQVFSCKKPKSLI